MSLAEKLKKLRLRHRMSMSEVARLSELSADQRGRITQGYLSRLESGKETNPSLQKILSLCSIYGVEPNEIILSPVRTRRPKSPFTTTTIREITQNTETGLRRVAEALARSTKHLSAVRDLVETRTGNQFLKFYGSLPETVREQFLKRALTAWHTT